MEFNFSLELTILWIFTNIILALIPIAINLVLIKILKISMEWYKALKGGELFIFSTTLSASSIGLGSIQNAFNNVLGTLSFCILILVIIISTVLFGVACFTKLKNENIPDEKLFAAASISCATLASIFSYTVAYMSGINNG